MARFTRVIPGSSVGAWNSSLFQHGSGTHSCLYSHCAPQGSTCPQQPLTRHPTHPKPRLAPKCKGACGPQVCISRTQQERAWRRNGRGKSWDVAERVQKVQGYGRGKRGQQLIGRRRASDRAGEQTAADQRGTGVKQIISRESAEKRHKNN